MQTREPLSLERGARAAGAAPGLPIVDDPATPRTRPRSTPPAATRSSWAASAATRRTSAASTCGSCRDNLLKGAATNAVQLAEVLHNRGLIRSRAAV